MRTRHLVDPELLEWVEQMPPVVFSNETLPLIRLGVAATIPERATAGSPGATASERIIPGGDGQPMSVFIYRPAELPSPAAAILQIHGGGYILGSAAMNDASNAALANTLRCVVVAVEYRLAPEAVHPGPVEDCYAALTWLANEAAELGIDPYRIAVHGESAGGGLAAALAHLTRDCGGPAICHQHLISPMLDDRTGNNADMHPHTGEYVWTREANSFGWRCLLGYEPGAQGVSPHAAAARAEDLNGLPPTYISVGALDLFFDEDLEYARRLSRAGVPIELHVWPGAYHGFEANAGAQITRAAGVSSINALRSALAIQAVPAAAL
jgi:triacylglycerol lipase